MLFTTWHTTGWQQQAEILGLLARRGSATCEVPISYHGRTYAEGKKIRAYHTLGVLWAIVATRFRWCRPSPSPPLDDGDIRHREVLQVLRVDLPAGGGHRRREDGVVDIDPM